MELHALAILSYGKEFSLLNRQESKKSLLPMPGNWNKILSRQAPTLVTIATTIFGKQSRL
jgi:hypothetical protein